MGCFNKKFGNGGVGMTERPTLWLYEGVIRWVCSPGGEAVCTGMQQEREAGRPGTSVFSECGFPKMSYYYP